MAETKVYFPELDSSPEEKALAIKVIDNYLNPTPVMQETRPALPKMGKKPKEKVINIDE